MNTKELRQAAILLHDWECVHGEEIEWNRAKGHPWHRSGAMDQAEKTLLLSRHILATVQEDGEEKVDEAWLREEWGWNGVARDKTTTDIGCGFIYGKLVPHEHGCDYYVANMVISQPTTRSQFRSLMAGLGVSKLVRPLDEEL